MRNLLVVLDLQFSDHPPVLEMMAARFGLRRRPLEMGGKQPAVYAGSAARSLDSLPRRAGPLRESPSSRISELQMVVFDQDLAGQGEAESDRHAEVARASLDSSALTFHPTFQLGDGRARAPDGFLGLRGCRHGR